jgi:hypothetical protein
MADQGAKVDEVERLCCNCNSSFPSEPVSSEHSICLHDPEFEPFLDDILERQDFGRCSELVKLKRFDWDQEACPDFDPVEDIEVELSPEAVTELEDLAARGELTVEAVQGVLLENTMKRADWREAPVAPYVDAVNRARTAEQRDAALNHLGWLVANGNRAAFDALCDLLRNQEPPATLSQTHFKQELLHYLRFSSEYRNDLADLLVDDLFRTPSNNQTRGWYTAVFRFFECSAPELADECLGRILGSPRFSYRIKRRVREIIRRNEELEGFGSAATSG